MDKFTKVSFQERKNQEKESTIMQTETNTQENGLMILSMAREPTFLPMQNDMKVSFLMVSKEDLELITT